MQGEKKYTTASKNEIQIKISLYKNYSVVGMQEAFICTRLNKQQIPGVEYPCMQCVKLPLLLCVCVSFQLCVVMIFLVTVIMCRGIITVVMFHTRNHILQTEVGIPVTTPFPVNMHLLYIWVCVCVIDSVLRQ